MTVWMKLLYIGLVVWIGAIEAAGYARAQARRLLSPPRKPYFRR